MDSADTEMLADTHANDAYADDIRANDTHRGDKYTGDIHADTVRQCMYFMTCYSNHSQNWISIAQNHCYSHAYPLLQRSLAIFSGFVAACLTLTFFILSVFAELRYFTNCGRAGGTRSDRREKPE